MDNELEKRISRATAGEHLIFKDHRLVRAYTGKWFWIDVESGEAFTSTFILDYVKKFKDTVLRIEG